jgi:hypothetical protein
MAFTVWHEDVNGRDGDSSYATLDDARRRFDELAGTERVCLVELNEIEDDDADPVTLHRWHYIHGFTAPNT